jgi:hypothetical protein
MQGVPFLPSHINLENRMTKRQRRHLLIWKEEVRIKLTKFSCNAVPSNKVHPQTVPVLRVPQRQSPLAHSTSCSHL